MEYGVTQIVVNALPVVTNAIDTDRGWHGIGDRSYRADTGVEISERTVLGYAPFWRACNIISNSVKGIPCDIFRRQRDGNKKYDRRHPAAPILKRKASKWWRADEMRRVMTVHALTHGNGYGPITRDQSDKPISVGLLDPNSMGVLLLEDGSKWYVYYPSGGKPVRIPDREMLHIKGLGSNGLVGYSVIDLLRHSLGVGMAAQQFAGKFFANGSNMSGILMVPGSFTEKKIENTIGAWNSMQTGLTNAHKIALLQDGVKWQPTTVSNEASQFIQTREFEVRQTISNITGVPPHMLGDSTRTSHNSLENEAKSFLTHCLDPWLQEWEAELMDKLLSDSQKENDTHLIEFNREATIQMEFETKVNGIYRQIEASIMTPNEGRRLLNMTSAGPDGDKFYHPANWLEVGQEPDPALAPSGGTTMAPREDGLENSVLRAMITSAVTRDLKIEQDRVVQRAGMRGENFIEAIDSFYAGWTAASAPGLTSGDARIAIISHAEESKRLLLDVAGVSTTESLKANVADVVATWVDRGQLLIETLVKMVTK